MDRRQHPLREQRRQHRRHEERERHALHRGPERLPQLVFRQDHRDADPDRAELLLAEEERLPALERAVGQDGAEERHGVAIEDGRQIVLFRDRLPLFGRQVVRDCHPFTVHDRRVGDVGGVADGGLEQRADPAVVAQRRIGIARARDDVERALENRLPQELAARRAFLEAEPGERRDMVGRQRRHDEHDQGRHAGDLA